MSRRQYFDDPSAPTPTRIVPAASAAVINEDDAILLEQRRDNASWGLPGGAMEVGETIAHTAVREVEEETGIAVEVTGLVGGYTDPRYVIADDDGEARQQFNLCFRARPVGGTLRVSSESFPVPWVAPAELPEIEIEDSIRLRIRHAFESALALPSTREQESPVAVYYDRFNHVRMFVITCDVLRKPAMW